MSCKGFFRFAAGCALILLARGTILAAEDKTSDLKQIPFVQRTFYRSYLVPGMDSRLQGESAAAIEFANPAANPWTRDHAIVHRVESGALRAGKNALKNYVIDSLRIDTWSIPLFETGKPGVSSGPATRDSRARLRFGISHLTPRAELSIPATYGRVALSADAKGAVDASYESHSYTFRVGVSFDPQEHIAKLTLGGRF